jgi:isochorismate synthase
MWPQIEKQLNRQLPFVVYRKPNQEEVLVIFQKDNSLHRVTDFSEKGFVFAAFNTQNAPVLLKNDQSLIFEFPGKEKIPNHLHIQFYSKAGQAEYIDLVKNAVDNIASDKFRKVVLSRVLEVENRESPISLLKKILGIYKNAFCYLWYHPKVGMWLGATPEILMQLKMGFLTTMSLAGTMKYEGIKHLDWGRKELNEQALVTDYILAALEDMVSALEKSEIETVRAGQLLHLRTRITGMLKEDRLSDLVRTLHPTPAICGYPKSEALNFILENEGYEREFYAGYLGELNLDSEESSTLYVNLRCMQIFGEKVKIYVGGGVTKDSDPKKEWQETVNKSETMLRVLIGKN